MAPKTAKPAPTHPKYVVMITDAIKTLKERTGSSAPAIAKVIKSKYDVPSTMPKQLSQQLRNLSQKGSLVKVKASYKLGDALKAKTPAKKVSKPKAAAGDKPKVKKVKSATKPAAAKPPKAKKPKTVKPKSATKPKAAKAKKPAAKKPKAAPKAAKA